MAAFKVDENLPTEVVDLLRAAGHDAMHVLDQKMGGQPDPHIADVCRREGRALVTLDLDFADIRRYPPQDFHGLIVLRPQRQDIDHILEVSRRVVTLVGVEPLQRHLWIADETSLRIRPGDE